jgi:RNA polymerase sigma factor (sigma-70 family)
MPADDLKTALEDVRQILLAEQEPGPSDGELLTRFLERRDEAAFAALVRRHAPMVWGVCRRTLRHTADVEDAFQATFLVLVRKADSVRPRERVGNWLYGVARQTALKARATAARRGARERQVARMPEPAPKRDPRDDLLAVLDEELGRLPDKYRAVLVLCDLEGQARPVAARQLGLPEGTVASRLARARSMLARRLVRRGLAVTAGSLATLLAEEAVAAPAAAVAAAIRAGCPLAAGAAGAAVSAQVLALTEGVVKAMLLTRLLKGSLVLLALGTAALVCGVLAAGGPKPPPPTEGEPAARQEPGPAPAGVKRLDPLPAGAVAVFGSPRLQDFTIDRSATFSPDGKRLATGGGNSPVCVWDTASGELVRTYHNHGSVFDLRWKADGKLAAVTFFNHDTFLMQEFSAETPDLSQEQDQRLHEETNRRERRGQDDKATQDRLDYCFLSPDGQRVAAVWASGQQNDRRVAVYRFTPAQTSDTTKPEREVPIAPGFGAWLSADGKFLLAHVAPAVPEANRLRAFDLTAGKDADKPAWELTFPGGETDRRPDFCFSPDGKRVVVLFWGGAAEVWDGPSGKRLRELPKLPWYYHHNNGERRGIDLTPDGKRLVLIDRDANGQMGGRVVEVDTGRDVCRLARRPLPRTNGVARFSADGKQVARVSFGVAAVWDAETGADACPLPGHRGDVNSLALLRGGKLVVTAGEDLTVRAWDPATGKEAWRAELPQVVRVKFATPDGAVVVQENFGNTGPALCLEGATGKRLPWPGKLAAAQQEEFLACSPDGRALVTLDGKEAALHVWTWPAGDLRRTLALVPPRRLKLARCGDARFTPDGKHFVAVLAYSDPAEQQWIRAVPDHPFIETWDPEAGKLLGQVEITKNQPVLIPHARGLYFWGKEDEIRDAVTGRALTKLHVPENRGLGLEWLRSLALSPDGRTVAAGWGFNDQHLLLFETRTGRFREMPPLPGRSVTGLSFLPDGRLVSAGTTATVWSVGLRPVTAAGADPLSEWEQLGDPDPEKAWPAMGKLAGTPTEALDLIGRQLRPVPNMAAESLDRILRNLDADQFEDREAAAKELDRLGALAVPRVKAHLARGPSAEVKRRLESFLADYERSDLSPAELRSLRAVEVLEAVGTEPARKLLAELAGGEPSAPLTREAAGAVDRLGRP